MCYRNRLDHATATRVERTDFGFVFRPRLANAYQPQKIVEKHVSIFNPEKRPPTDHVCHTFHHNLTTKTPHPSLRIRKNPSKIAVTNFNSPTKKNCSTFDTRKRRFASVPSPRLLLAVRPDVATSSRPGRSCDFYCGDVGTWKSTVTVCWTPLLVAVTVIG